MPPHSVENCLSALGRTRAAKVGNSFDAALYPTEMRDLRLYCENKKVRIQLTFD